MQRIQSSGFKSCCLFHSFLVSISATFVGRIPRSAHYSHKLKFNNVFVRRVHLHFVNNRSSQSQHRIYSADEKYFQSRLKTVLSAENTCTTVIGRFVNTDARSTASADRNCSYVHGFSLYSLRYENTRLMCQNTAISALYIGRF